MRRLIFFVMILTLLASGASAEFLGIKQASEFISLEVLEPLDSAFGIPRLPDSVHVFTYADNATTATFSTRSTTYPFSAIGIDTVKQYGDTSYYFVDQIQDIDGAGGHFSLAITVKMFYDDIPTSTFATVQIVNDSLATSLDDATLALAEVVNIDAWDPTTDSVIANSNLRRIDWSGTAAELLRDAFDDSVGSSARLELEQFHVISAQPDSSSVLFANTNADDGPRALEISKATAGVAIHVISVDTAVHFEATSSINSYGLLAEGGKAGLYGFSSESGSFGALFESSGGIGAKFTGATDGANFSATGTGGDGASFDGGTWNGSSGAGIRVGVYRSASEDARGIIISSSINGLAAFEVWNDDGIAVHYLSPNDTGFRAQGGLVDFLPAPGGLSKADVFDAIWGGDQDSISWPAGTWADSASGWGATSAGSLTLAGIAKEVMDTMRSEPIDTVTGTGTDSLLLDYLRSSSPVSIYAEFTSGSNEDVFKATGFSTHSDADVWTVVTRTLTGTQTFSNTGTWTGNITGSVGSVTGSVGSVTGAVGSVTGNVGGNVTGTVASVVGDVGGNVDGSVASVTGAVGSVTANVDANVATWIGEAIPATSVTGVPKVDLGYWKGVVPNDLTSNRVDAQVIGMGANTISAAALASDAVTEIMDSTLAAGRLGSVQRVIANQIITIDGATPSVTGFSATELTQGDDYWTDQMIMVLTGNAAGQAARTTDFTAATDSITFSPALSVAPAQNDTVIILSLFYEEAAGGSSPWSEADKDSVVAAVSDGSMSDKIWVDGTPTNRDSVVAAVADASIGDKVWTDASPRVATSVSGNVDGSVGSVVAEVDADITAIAGDAPAADSLARGLDGYSDGQLSNREHLFTNLDEVISTRSKIGDTTIGGDERDLVIAALHDTLIYQGSQGPGIYIDSAAGNTNTVIGTDGTAKNPVSTLVAAKTLATALGHQRYYLINQSTFNDAANDLSSDHSNWEFIGVGHISEVAFGSQLVTGSKFCNLGLSGAMHASGGDVLFKDCILGYITTNYAGHAENCWLTDTLVLNIGVDIEFADCQSGVAGENTPTLDFSLASSAISMRNYSGGIRLMHATTLDTISVETDGQVIISANCTNLHASLRGNMVVTDSGTTTNLTREAALNLSDIAQRSADSGWNYPTRVLTDTTNISDLTIQLEAMIDTLSWWAGWYIGAKSHTDYATTEDTIWVVSPANDTLGVIIYKHEGGAAGDPPDSVKVEAKP